IRVYADRGNGAEIVVLGAEVVEVILDLAGEIFYEPELDSRADGETGAVVGDDCGGGGCARSRASCRACGEEVFCVPNVQPGAASLGIEQPIVRGITEPSSQSGKPLGLRREAFLRDGFCSELTSGASDQGISANRRIGPCAFDPNDPRREFVVRADLCTA